MISESQLEDICDELAKTIDDAEGDIDVGTAIDTIVAENSDGTDAGSLRSELLVKFNELYECNPSVYAENSTDDIVWGRENVIMDNLDNHEIDGLDDVIPLESLDDLL